MERHDSGYRVWVAGTRYPFYIPSAHYHRDRFRVGLVIQLGGYYNPRGYYDYYDGYDRYYDSRRSSRDRAMRGIVERVDRRRDRFVLRDDRTGRFITVFNHDRQRVRAGDYVEVYGEWTRAGVFHAHDVDRLDHRYGRRR